MLKRESMRQLLIGTVAMTLLAGCGTAEPKPQEQDANTTKSVSVDENVSAHKQTVAKRTVSVAEYEEMRTNAACADMKRVKESIAILISKMGELEALESKARSYNGNGAKNGKGKKGSKSANGGKSYDREIAQLRRQISELIEKIDSYENDDLNRRSQAGENEGKVVNFGRDKKAGSGKSYDKEIAELRRQIKELQANAIPVRKTSSKADLLRAKNVEEKYCRNIQLVSINPKSKYKAKSNIIIRPCPNKASKALGIIKKGTIVQYRGCDIFGWCELKDGSGFVAAYMFRDYKKPTKRGSK